MAGKCKHNRNYSIIEQWYATIDHVYKNGQFQKPYYGSSDVHDPTGILTLICDDCDYQRTFNTRKRRIPEWFRILQDKWETDLANRILVEYNNGLEISGNETRQQDN